MEETIENIINNNGDIFLELLYLSDQLQANIFDIDFIIPQLEEPIHQRVENIELDIEYIKYDKDCMKTDPCSICFENFTEDSMVCNIACNHVFHQECISEWGKWKQNCPYCKRSISIKT